MPKETKPRSGSMGVWPRKRSKKPRPRVRNWPESNKKGMLCFPCYKAGMTSITGVDAGKHSPTKGDIIEFGATILECPPVKIHSIRLYKKNEYGLKLVDETPLATTPQLLKKYNVQNTNPDFLEKINLEEYDEIRVTIYTQPHRTSIGRKKPQLFEAGLGGTKEEKLEFIKENLKKDVPFNVVFKKGDQVDIRAVTKGKGTEGPVKRFGISLKPHKSEKGRRRPGSLGAWKGNQHWQHRVPHAGQRGYHQRIQHNNLIIQSGAEPENVNPEGGFMKYGLVKSNYVIVKGSVPGPKKRMSLFTKPVRKKKEKEAPTVKNIDKNSQQGR